MNHEPLWKLTHENKCPHTLYRKNEEPCTCDPQNRIKLIQHLIAGYPLDPSLREAMLREIEKCTSK